MRLVLVLLLAVAIAVGVFFRDEVELLLGLGPPPEHVVIRAKDLNAAWQFLDRKYSGTKWKVSIEKDRITITGNGAADDFGIMMDLDPKLHPVPAFTVAVVDYVAPYFTQLRPRLHDTATTLGITTAVDAIGEHLVIPDKDQYVNEAYATRHKCTGRRIEGTGLLCTVTPRDRLMALMRGDADLFVDPPDASTALPVDRDFFVARTNAYLVERTPLAISPATITGITNTAGTVAVALTPAGVAELAARATDKTTEIAIAIDDQVAPIKPTSDGFTFAIAHGADELADTFTLRALGLDVQLE